MTSMDSPYSSEIEIAVAALQQAAILSQSIISHTDKGVVQKTDISPVTVADFAVQALLSATFHHHFPTDGLVGEESADELRTQPELLARVWALLEAAAGRKGEDSLCRTPESPERACDLIDMCGAGSPGRPGRVWVFDPIDGTKTYIRGEVYATNVALLEDGKQVLSVVACPNLSSDVTGPITDKSIDMTGRGTVLFASKGHGAYIRPLHPQGQPIHPRRLNPHPQEPTPNDLRFVSCTTAQDSGALDFHRAAASGALGMLFPGCDLVPWVVRWASMAMGLANTTIWVYNDPERRGKVWDHAGAMLLFEEVGGKITDVHGRDIDLGAGRVLSGNFSFVASLPGLHPMVLEKTRQTMVEFGNGHMLE